jgi:hypothetical protein
MSTTLQDVLGFVMCSTREQRESIMQAVRYATQRDASHARMEFRPGSTVKFKNRYGTIVHGIVKKVNRKNIDLVEDGTGMRWRVHPSLLEAE